MKISNETKNDAKSKETCQEIDILNEKLKEKDEKLEQLQQKYVRHRKIWEENEQKSVKEFAKLDKFIGALLDTFNNLPSELKNSVELKPFLEILNQNESLK